MLIKIYPENPNEKSILRVAEILRNDGIVIYPTDGVYAYGCSLASRRAFEKLKALKKKKGDDYSIMCADLSCIADYARVDTPEFKILKRNLPGPFTFILNASGRVPDKVLGNRKTVGVRVANNNIALAIVRELGTPLITSSVREDDAEVEYTTDPELIDELRGGSVDLVIDGGFGGGVPTTLVDLTGDEPEILREGGGELEL